MTKIKIDRLMESSSNHFWYAGHTDVPIMHGELIPLADIPVIVVADLPEMAEISSDGQTYISRTPDAESANKVWQWCKENNVPRPVPKDELHVTLFTLNKRLDWDGSKAKPITVDTEQQGSLHFVQQEGRRLLVLTLANPELINRRATIVKALKNNSRDTSVPHMTISYDVSRFTGAGLTKIVFPITLDKETLRKQRM